MMTEFFVCFTCGSGCGYAPSATYRHAHKPSAALVQDKLYSFSCRQQTIVQDILFVEVHHSSSSFHMSRSCIYDSCKK